MISNERFNQIDRARAGAVWATRNTLAILLIAGLFGMGVTIAVWGSANAIRAYTGQDWTETIERATGSRNASQSATDAAQGETYHDPALWAAPNETEGTEPGPVTPLGYTSQAEAAANCSDGQAAQPLHRQRQIVGWGCVR